LIRYFRFHYFDIFDDFHFDIFIDACDCHRLHYAFFDYAGFHIDTLLMPFSILPPDDDYWRHYAEFSY
jgi:hypothetical protein